MSAARRRYFGYRVFDAGATVRWGLASLPVHDAVSARLLLERRSGGTVLSLYLLPFCLVPVLDFFRRLLSARLAADELGHFFHSLGVMLRAGVAMDKALLELDQADSPRRLRVLARHLLANLKAGQTLSDGLRQFEPAVPVTVRALVGIGEQSGCMDKVLIDAGDHLKRIHAISQDIRKAMIYPAFVLVAVMGAALFWVYYVLPDLSLMFMQMGVALPATTLWVMGAVRAAGQLLAATPAAALVGLIAVLWLAVRSEAVEYALFWLAYHLPASRTIVRASSMAFITEYLALLYGAGVNLVEAVRVLEGSIGNRLFRRKLGEVRAGLLRGSRLSTELERAKVFPRLVIRLTAIGETAGDLEGQLRVLADEYRRRQRIMIESLAEVLKPVVIAIAGGFFIFIVVVFMLPIYSLISQTANL
ncbi:type II secretion system F family protein [Thauera mechernichensis]